MTKLGESTQLFVPRFFGPDSCLLRILEVELVLPVWPSTKTDSANHGNPVERPANNERHARVQERLSRNVFHSSPTRITARSQLSNVMRQIPLRIEATRRIDAQQTDEQRAGRERPEPNVDGQSFHGIILCGPGGSILKRIGRHSLTFPNSSVRGRIPPITRGRLDEPP